jgi:hypothetical protein
MLCRGSRAQKQLFGVRATAPVADGRGEVLNRRNHFESARFTLWSAGIGASQLQRLGHFGIVALRTRIEQ